MSSFYGQYINYEKVKAGLEDFDSLTVEKLDEILQWFLSDFKENKLQDNGWPITVNNVHPGVVKTEMTCYTGNLTAEEGARFAVMLALSPEDTRSGLFFNEMNVSSF
ncbi:salutaridine reductase-like [Pistacia vera]|uniref:salutaridine reductase-like n=1 Tax=Pistacia vera TaxID=55513 RepID=UPI0012638C96|nr:salutaridine reductase-like [Pistacia vera]